MPTIIGRFATVLAAAAASLLLATSAPASAAPEGPVSLSAIPSSDDSSIVLTYTNNAYVGAATCESTVRGVGADGATIVTRTRLTDFAQTTTVTVTPPRAGLYAITFYCPPGFGWGGSSSSKDTPLFVTLGDSFYPGY